MDKDPEHIENGEQSREEAKAQTLELLRKAESWTILAAYTNRDGDLCGAAKLYINRDELADVMINTGRHDIVFAEALLKAAYVISHAIKNTNKVIEVNEQ